MIGVDRRRVMGGLACPYVTDGLIFWMDGIEKGSDSTAWTDLIGGTYKFPYNEHSTVETDCIHMDGKGSLTLNSTEKLCYWRMHTLEVVAQKIGSGAGAIYNSGWQDYMSCICVSDGFRTGPSGYTEIRWDIKVPSTIIYSLVGNNPRFLNGTKYTTKLLFASYPNTNQATLGGLLSNNFIECKVHCIRMYNRKLTDAELLANQAVDNERFNLGLTI